MKIIIIKTTMLGSKVYASYNDLKNDKKKNQFLCFFKTQGHNVTQFKGYHDYKS
jgi:hypothetical protein